MTKAAAEKVYKTAGVTPNDIDVIELHDCFSANELITYEALGKTVIIVKPLFLMQIVI